MADGRGLEGVIPYWIQLAKDTKKIGNPIKTTELAFQWGEEKFPIRSGFASGIIGIGIKEAGDAIGNSMIKRGGSAMSKYGFSLMTSSLVAGWIYLSRFNPHGVPGGGGPMKYTGDSYNYSDRGTIIQDNPQGMVPIYGGPAPEFRSG
jgi:hypothetical protein